MRSTHRPARRLRTGSRTRTRRRRATRAVPRTIPAISATFASDPSIDALRLAWLCVSLADTKHTISSTPAPSARSAPRALGTSAAIWASARRRTRASTSCASASCGTARGLTNDVASMWRTPAAISASMTSALTSVGIELRFGLEAVAGADLGDRDSGGRSCVEERPAEVGHMHRRPPSCGSGFSRTIPHDHATRCACSATISSAP